MRLDRRCRAEPLVELERRRAHEVLDAIRQERGEADQHTGDPKRPPRSARGGRDVRPRHRIRARGSQQREAELDLVAQQLEHVPHAVLAVAASP